MKFIGLNETNIKCVEITAKHLELKFQGEIEFKESDALRVYKQGERVVVEYTETCEIHRGLSFVDRVAKTNEKTEQMARVKNRYLYADCCRNGVMTVEALKEWVVTAATMGFNNIQMYVEDLFPLPDYPYFGHKRGAYSKEEIKELDSFALDFGLKLGASFQTLGHLAVIKDWKCFQSMFDIDDILLVDNEETYKFIEAEIKAVTELFSGKVSIIGMDEAHNLGRGKYMDIHGPSNHMELLLNHLDKVAKICEKYGMEPVISTDMIYKLSGNGGYWSKDAKMSQEIIDKIPENVILGYWDYYFTEPELIENMCCDHSESGRKTMYTCGTWNWHGFTPKNYYSNRVTPLQVETAVKYGFQDIMVANFGDDGAECPMFAVLPSTLTAAEIMYVGHDEENLQKRSMDCFGLSFDDFMKIDAIGVLGEEYDYQDNCPSTLEKAAFYNDIMTGVMNYNIKQFNIEGKYARDAEILETVPHSRYDYLFNTQIKYAKALAIKALLPIELKEAYKRGDKDTLKVIANEKIPACSTAVKEFEKALCEQWHKIFKPFGYDVQQMRIGAMLLRLDLAADRINKYLSGELDRLEELETEDLEFMDGACKLRGTNSWRKSFTRSQITWS